MANVAEFNFNGVMVRAELTFESDGFSTSVGDYTWRSSSADLDERLNAFVEGLNLDYAGGYDPDPPYRIMLATIEAFDGIIVEHETAPEAPGGIY